MADYTKIPDELKALPNWVNCYQDKIPRDPKTGNAAKTSDPSTWGTFAQATEAVKAHGVPYIGFVFDGKNGYFGVDLDNCMDNVDLCDEFVETLGSYAEISQSGKGLHIICKGVLPAGGRRRGGVEMYSSGRYFICTGNIYNDKYTQIQDCTEQIKILHGKYIPSSAPSVGLGGGIITLDDQEVIDKARNSKGGEYFNLLYSGSWQGMYTSQSEADLALCNQLAFWTGKDPVQMDRLFRASGLYRDKWDKRRGADTYGNITIGKAIASCVAVYGSRNDFGGDSDTSLALAVFKGAGGLVGPSGGTVGGAGVAGMAYDATDTGNAKRIYDRFKDVIRYSYNRKRWYFWDGKRWQIDDGGEVKKLADVICEDLKREAFMADDPEVQQQILKFAHRSAASRAKEAMIKEVQHLDGIPASPDDFDAYGDYLNCQNGVVNLRNGELVPHDPHFMMSKMTLCEYDVTHKEPRLWMKFLDDVTGGDKELQLYLQKAVGYSLTGSAIEQCAFFLYGMGNNGKSTFLDTIAEVLGGYSANTQPDTLMLGRAGSSGGSAGSDIARLKSIRFVTSEEPTEGVRLNEGLLKQLTGGGSKITCRFLYGDEFEYVPEFKLWVATNHKPVIRGTDVGIWRRIRLIPFEMSIDKDKVDKHLRYKLRAEFPQILAWAVRGAVAWGREGMGECDRVRVATAEYKSEMDLIASFIEQCIVIDYGVGGAGSDGDAGGDAGASVGMRGQDLFALYLRWAKINNEFEMSSKRFFREASLRLPDKKKDMHGIVFKGVRASDYALSMDGDDKWYWKG